MEERSFGVTHIGKAAAGKSLKISEAPAARVTHTA